MEMDRRMAERFQEHFGKMTDPRVDRTKGGDSVCDVVWLDMWR